MLEFEHKEQKYLIHDDHGHMATLKVELGQWVLSSIERNHYVTRKENKEINRKLKQLNKELNNAGIRVYTTR